MNRPGNQFLLALGVISLVALLAFVVQKKGLASQEAAAYVQAFLSAGSILAAVKIAHQQRVDGRRSAQGRQLDALVFVHSRAQGLLESLQEIGLPKQAAVDFYKVHLQAELDGLAKLNTEELGILGYLISTHIRLALSSPLLTIDKLGDFSNLDAVVKTSLESLVESRRLIVKLFEKLKTEAIY